MDDAAKPRPDRLPSIKQILAILAAGVLLFPGLCLAVAAAGFINTSTGITIMIVTGIAAVLFTFGGVVLFLIRAIRDFMRH